MPSPLAVDIRGLSKRFAGVVANERVDFQLAPGEIHALLGENGAGKTTLMNILYGLYPPDAGEIFIWGKPVHFSSPSHAIAHGIGMVHQHFMLVPNLSVTENIILGQEGSTFWLHLRRATQRLHALAAQYQLDVDPRAIVQDLPVGVRQRVEILKALYRQARILILDEPTAVLTPVETAHLFCTLEALAEQGTAIVFITHKLREVFPIAHRITVLRGGRVAGRTRPELTTPQALAALMVGHEVPAVAAQASSPALPPLLRVQHLCVLDDRGAQAVDNVSFTVQAGEIFGIAGVQGNGQTELVEAITGLRTPQAGQVWLRGVDMTHAPPAQLLAAGVAHIPEDRHKYGMVASESVADNLVLNTYARPPFARWGTRRYSAIAQYARQVVHEFDIRVADVFAKASSLSGGNQQKLVIARECAHPRSLLVAAQPTRGLDIGAIASVQQRLVQQRDQGCAVLLVSTELDEILTLADRITVMYRGQLLAPQPAAAMTRDGLGRLLAGLPTQGTG